MNQARNAADLIGRILLALFFIPSGIGKVTAYAATAAFMGSHGIPGLLLPLVILTEVGGGLLVLLGWRTRIAAFLVGGFSIIAVLVFHLHPTDDAGRIIQLAELAVGGGLWILAARGPGGWSIDGVLARHRASGGVARSDTVSRSA